MAWLGTVMTRLLTQAMQGSKEKSSENDDLAPTLQFIAART